MFEWDLYSSSHVAFGTPAPLGEQPSLGGHPAFEGLSWMGPQYLLTDSHELVSPSSVPSLVTGSHATGPLGLGLAGGAASGPASTLVGSAGGLQFNLVWDSSVRTAANWSAIESAVVSAAQIYTGAFSNHLTLTIQVGLGVIAGSKMSSGALGESESTGYLTSYANVSRALASHDAGLVQSGQVAAGAFTPGGAIGSGNFFVASAEAKALGLVKATTSGVDGYIGLGVSSIYYPASGGHIGSNQYDAVGVAAHELSEVMGRTGMLGAALGGKTNVYTPLDLFRFSAPGKPDTTPGTGYFSTNLGRTSVMAYNNPSNGGDASDWAGGWGSAADAYNAFGRPGATNVLSSADLLEDAVLGYQLAPTAVLSGQARVV